MAMAVAVAVAALKKRVCNVSVCSSLILNDQVMASFLAFLPAISNSQELYLQTTYENFRYRYENSENFFNRGILMNFSEVFCTSIPPSKIKFRSKIPEESFISAVKNSELIDSASNLTSKPVVDVEMGVKSMWSSIADHMVADDVEVLHGQPSHGIELGIESKGDYEDAILENLEHTAGEDDVIRAGVHPRRSSWGRKSESWEFPHEILALAVGDGARMKGDSTSPIDR